MDRVNCGHTKVTELLYSVLMKRSFCQDSSVCHILYFCTPELPYFHHVVPLFISRSPASPTAFPAFPLFLFAIIQLTTSPFSSSQLVPANIYPHLLLLKTYDFGTLFLVLLCFGTFMQFWEFIHVATLLVICHIITLELNCGRTLFHNLQFCSL